MASAGRFMINYTHDKGGTSYVATVTEIDGNYHATWTVTKDGRERTRDGIVSREQFKLLWNTIAESPVFHRSFAANPNTRMDWVQFHIVGIAFEAEGEQGAVSYLVPNSERDPEFLNWLRTLSATYGTKWRLWWRRPRCLSE
jgi:hypothetical protein